MKVLWRSGVLTLKPEQSGGVGLIPGKTPPLEHHDKGLRTRLEVCCLSVMLGAEKCNFTSTFLSGLKDAFMFPLVTSGGGGICQVAGYIRQLN